MNETRSGFTQYEKAIHSINNQSKFRRASHEAEAPDNKNVRSIQE
jgi:hypothetical protein